MTSTIQTSFLTGWVAISSLLLGWIVFKVQRNLSRFRILGLLELNFPSEWPKVSMIIPARNEAETLGPALHSVLSLDYPNLEIVIVNDRSTDDTGKIIENFSQKDPRIIPVHIQDLPQDWLGKVNALEQGRLKATGTWLLFADADVFWSDQ